MSTWSLNGLAASALNIEDIVLHHTAWGQGSATFRCKEAALGTNPTFGVGTVVTIADPLGRVRFSGPVLKVTPSGTAESEWHDYVVAGPSHWAERTVYLQSWQLKGGTAQGFSSRVLLGVKQVNGSWGQPITMGEAAVNVITFLQGFGLPVAVGRIDLPGYFKVAELNGVTCMEALRSICKWQPDAVAYWTYGTPNKLNIVRRANLPDVVKTIDGVNVTTVGFTKRADLVPAAVSVLYERVDTIDGHQYPNFTLDVAPNGDSGAGLNKLHFTVPLHGSNYRFIKERIVTRTMHLDPAMDYANTCRFVGAKLGLNGVAVSISGATPPAAQLAFYPVDDGGAYFTTALADATEADGSQDPLAEADAVTMAEEYFQQNPNTAYDGPTAKAARKIVLDDSLEREVVHGHIKPWMGEKAQKQLISCRVQYSLRDGTIVGPVTCTFQVMATTATSRIYSEMDSAQIGETAPVGVAAQIYAALTVPHYEGDLRFQEQECSGSVYLGCALNLAGGAGAWASMNAVVQTVTEDIASGRTEVNVGPPTHLSPGDFIDLQRSIRSMIGVIGQDFRNVWRMASGFV